MIFLLLKSLVMGFLMAAPVGPVGVLALRRSLKSGWLGGFVTGFAVAVVDGFFGFVSSIGLTSVTDFFRNHEQPVRWIGGVVLLVVAFFIFRNPPANLDEKSEQTEADDVASDVGIGRLIRYFFSALFIALSNPLAIFSFAAVYLGFGFETQIAERSGLIFIFVAGVIVGSCVWWAILSLGAAHFRERLSTQTLRRINYCCGAVVAVSGIWSLLWAFASINAAVGS